VVDLKVVGVGAGLAVGLAFIGWLFVTAGQSAKQFGGETGLGFLGQIGDILVGYGNLIIVVLVIGFIIIVGAVILSMRN
jgi:hypothetical protein